MGKLEAQQMKLLEKRVAFLERVIDAMFLNAPTALAATPPNNAAPALLSAAPIAAPAPAGSKEDDDKDAIIAQWRRRTMV